MLIGEAEVPNVSKITETRKQKLKFENLYDLKNFLIKSVCYNILCINLFHFQQLSLFQNNLTLKCQIVQKKPKV